MVKLVPLSLGFFVLFILILTARELLLLLMVLSIHTREISLVFGVTDPAKQL